MSVEQGAQHSLLEGLPVTSQAGSFAARYSPENTYMQIKIENPNFF